MSRQTLTELRAKARRAIHGAFSVEGSYLDPFTPEPLPITVRWHHRIDRFGDLNSAGYAEQIDGIERAIFNVEQLQEAGITLRRGGVITLSYPGWDGIQLRLDTREPRDGPIEEIWGVGAIGT